MYNVICTHMLRRVKVLVKYFHNSYPCFPKEE